MKRCLKCRVPIKDVSKCPIPALDKKQKRVEVFQATKAVHGPQVDRIKNKPRGMCIIFNNGELNADSNQKEACNNDAENLKSLFADLGFNVIEYRNLKAGNILLELVNASDSEDLKFADCLIVIFMTCGTKDVIRCADGELCLNRQVYPLFNQVNCPDLQGKPKLFFVQTSENRDVKGRSKNGSDSIASEAGLEYSGSRWSDMYCAHGTIPSNVPVRKTKEGTWFLSAVHSVFRQHAATDGLKDLMQRVANVMTEQSLTRTPNKALNVLCNRLKKGHTLTRGG